MVVSIGLLQAHFVGDASAARAAVARLCRRGLVYVEGPAVRLTLPGFAQAVAAMSVPAAADPFRGRGASSASRAA
jgi:hypothetical protein